MASTLSLLMPFGAISIFFTSAIMFLSTYVFVILVLSKQKPQVVADSASEENPKLVEESSPRRQDLAAREDLPFKQQKDKIVEYSTVGSVDVLSESESLDQMSSTEDSGVDWASQDSRNRSPDCSDDGSISDEESLIEIALPGGYTVGHHEEDPKLMRFEQSIFQQRGLMELLAEFNEMYEEENLIEIDISMGSIKCTRFEIEA